MAVETVRLAQDDSSARPATAVHESLTTAQKVRLLVGSGMWTTTPIPSIGLRGIALSDGPAGVRGTTDDDAETSAAFPAPSALGATWDTRLAAKLGEAFAAEARRHGVDVVLAPQVNLQRTPVAGRHFECFSEDPLLTSSLAVPLVTASQRRGVGMCVKHFVANDSETERTSYLSRVDERTLREVYLEPFESLVRAGIWCVMGAYNGVDDGLEAAPVLEHHHLMTDVLKEEWGFDGVLVSDWVATKTVVPPVRAGMDLQMPGPDGPWGDGLERAIAAGEVAAEELDDKALRVLRLAERVGALGTPAALIDDVDVPAVLREVVARSLVVIKDDTALLPLARPGRIALVGPNASRPFLAGGGSSKVRADREVPLLDAVASAFPQALVSVRDGAVSRFTAPPLDLREATAPDGRPGMRAELLAGDGSVLRAWTAITWDENVQDLPDDAVAVRLRTHVPLVSAGVHRIGIGTVGRHRIVVDDVEISASTHSVGAEVVLDSSWNHPPAVMVPLVGPGAVELDVTVQVVHPVGYDTFLRARLQHEEPGVSPEEMLADAVAAAAAADVAVVVVGTNEEVESEGWDRTDLSLPGTQDELVRAVLAVQPNTIVVVNAGAPVLLPWLAQAPCVVWGWLGGQEWTSGLADALSGVVEPAGRLPWTLPARADDVPVPSAVPVDGVVDYGEGVHVGYRSWELLGRTPAAPFGHGLGWTRWEYLDAAGAWGPDGTAVVSVSVRNSGQRAGREVVQVYLEPPDGTPRGSRPVRWLGGFAVVDADPGQETTAYVRLHPHALRTWSPERAGWVTPAGSYRICVGRSSRDVRLTTALTVPGPAGVLTDS
ncbi:MAG TPA: glycoside hydrolase family 3 C-terminal domain-containing protein [Propionicimonas sp.]